MNELLAIIGWMIAVFSTVMWYFCWKRKEAAARKKGGKT